MDFYWPFYKRILYLFLPMHILWGLLNEETREYIRSSNKLHNNNREDYSGKKLYGEFRNEGGLIWESFDYEKVKNDPYINLINNFFKKKLGTSIRVLEIGPGGGFYTKYIINNENIKAYTGIEISNYFAECLKQRFDEIGKNQFLVINGDALEEIMSLEENKFDLIILASSLHHLPDRDKLFIELARVLDKKGEILIKEPCHYLPRIADLIRKILFQKDVNGNSYLSAKHFCRQKMIAIHHFLSLEEIKFYISKTKNLKINIAKYKFGRNKFYKLLFKRFASSQIYMSIIKN